MTVQDKQRDYPFTLQAVLYSEARMVDAVDTHRVFKSSHGTAQSAARIIRLHNAYVAVEPKDEQPIRCLYLRELTIMMRRCLRLAGYLLVYRKRDTSKTI
jgi:hypothetical protein